MNLDDLDYELPEHLIAQHPAARREDARLLIVERASGRLHDAHVAEIGAWLASGDVLAVNETRVMRARLEVHRPTGGRVELLFVRPGADGAWHVLARPARRVVPGQRLTNEVTGLALEVVAAREGGERLVLVVAGDLFETLALAGRMPLPPYIRRAPDAEDLERYQTVFARVDGAVAAPTAGLHFSAELLAELARSGIDRVPLVLHVGPGTFRPIVTADPADHPMDAEWYELDEVTAGALRAARERGGRIVAVGTTSVRTLESACDANGGRLAASTGWTRKYILPPYRFQAVDALLTNFHLPKTTLLLLVAALTGPELLKAAYAHAVREKYRFYSYGDAMLVV